MPLKKIVDVEPRRVVGHGQAYNLITYENGASDMVYISEEEYNAAMLMRSHNPTWYDPFPRMNFKQAISQDYLVLDFETTGLETYDQICSATILNREGEILFNSLIQPTVAMSEGARNVNKITNVMLAAAPLFRDVEPQIRDILNHRHIFSYNADFDKRMLQQTAQACTDGEAIYGVYFSKSHQWHCVMESYAGGRRWLSLTKACKKEGVKMKAVHSSLGDAQSTLALIQKVWA